MLICYRIPETGVDACGLARGTAPEGRDLITRTTHYTSLVSCPLCLECVALMYV